DDAHRLASMDHRHADQGSGDEAGGLVERAREALVGFHVGDHLGLAVGRHPAGDSGAYGNHHLLERLPRLARGDFEVEALLVVGHQHDRAGLRIEELFGRVADFLEQLVEVERRGQLFRDRPHVDRLRPAVLADRAGRGAFFGAHFLASFFWSFWSLSAAPPSVSRTVVSPIFTFSRPSWMIVRIPSFRAMARKFSAATSLRHCERSASDMIKSSCKPTRPLNPPPWQLGQPSPLKNLTSFGRSTPCSLNTAISSGV